MSYSQELFAKANTLIPGGVNSPVRAFKGVGGDPIFFKQGKGAYLIDVDNKQYIDFVGSWGPLILGHCHPKVLEAVSTALHSGMSFGAPTELEIQLAEKIIELMPNIEKIRMVNFWSKFRLNKLIILCKINSNSCINCKKLHSNCYWVIKKIVHH